MLGSCLTGSALVFGEGWTVEASAIRASIPPSATIAEAPDSAMKPSAVSIGLAGMSGSDEVSMQEPASVRCMSNARQQN